MEISEQLLKEIITKVVVELKVHEEPIVKHKDESGVIAVQARTVCPEPFDTGKKGDKVFLTDLLTLEESPRIGCGIMEMDQSHFEWTLNYDEIDYIIEGELEIIINGNTIRGEKGDVIFIPKNSDIIFSSPGFARFLYVVYPANWQQQ
ncbi:cupin domain-containing protein [Cellulosilyticum sp. I15G10I2]|uniref:cupin domain-containing protein n=1 Tax=Cellulosilyticum sp. I15G10I2 TaxID=1892843 RepID=UPI000944C6C8|nr:cupin domain-containing protein [Cellulosilyticum sp. I15G10I2]